MYNTQGFHFRDDINRSQYQLSKKASFFRVLSVCESHKLHVFSIRRDVGFHFPRNMLLDHSIFPKQERTCFNFFINIS